MENKLEANLAFFGIEVDTPFTCRNPNDGLSQMWLQQREFKVNNWGTVYSKRKDTDQTSQECSWFWEALMAGRIEVNVKYIPTQGSIYYYISPEHAHWIECDIWTNSSLDKRRADRLGVYPTSAAARQALDQTQLLGFIRDLK